MKHTICILLLIFGINNCSYSQNIVFVFRDSVLTSIPNYIKNLREIELLRANLDSNQQLEMQKLQIEANKLFSKYPKDPKLDFNALKSKMTPTDLVLLEEIDIKSAKLDQKKKEHQKTIEAAQSQKLVPLMYQLRTIIEQYSASHNIDIMYFIEDIRDKIAYINPKKDVTEDIIRMLNK